MKALAAFFAPSALALPAGAGAAPVERPNIVVVMTDDQTLESMRVMTRRAALLAAEGTTFDRASSRSRSAARRARRCSPASTRTTTACSATPRRPAATAGSTSSNWLPVWLQRAGYHTAHIGKYLNGYGDRNPTEVPPGWSEWHGSVDPSTYLFYGYTLNENGAARAPTARRDPTTTRPTSTPQRPST